ncbi:MAG: hypothetical protein DRH03_05875 [Deltaproteobacteria bacterium]|nr:MAG: hypothetical protein DRH03_05875 [Deltaproteobacteria bacterium]
MNSYPVNLLLENRQCLVIGGGPVALREVTRLLTNILIMTLNRIYRRQLPGY